MLTALVRLGAGIRGDPSGYDLDKCFALPTTPVSIFTGTGSQLLFQHASPNDVRKNRQRAVERKHASMTRSRYLGSVGFILVRRNGEQWQWDVVVGTSH